MLIGRKEEQAELQRLYDSGRAEFVAIYGRRRVGKTFLVKEMFGNRLAFYHSGLSPFDKSRRVTMRDQLDSFYASLLNHGMDESSCPTTWMTAFAMLGKLLDNTAREGERQVIFIDELPWMDTARSKFLVAFEHFWNSWGAWRDRVMLIVCGSASSWILDNVINNKGGLYDRLTCQLKLSPFTLAECREYFTATDIAMSDYDIAEAYMVFGGVPYYLSHLRRGMSVAQSIDNAFFGRNARLGQEYQRLFGSLFTNPEAYMSIVQHIAARNVGMTRQELAQNTSISTSSLTQMLDALCASDFIAAYTPLGAKRGDVRYRLIDNYCRFVLQFIVRKQVNDDAYWQHNVNSPAVNAWRGIAFEMMCFNHARQIKRALGVENVASTQSAWIVQGDEGQRGGQIDMVICRDDRVVNLCEMKFVSGDLEVTAEQERLLRNRLALLQQALSPRQTVHITLVTTFGLKHGAHSGIFQQVVTLADLVR